MSIVESFERSDRPGYSDLTALQLVDTIELILYVLETFCLRYRNLTIIDFSVVSLGAISIMLKGLFSTEVISPVQEIASYEALWTRYTTFSQLAKLFRQVDHALPSSVASSEGITTNEVDAVKDQIGGLLPFTHYGALFYKDFEYPEKLRDAAHPVEVLYYRGALDLLSSPAVSVVGARKATDEGKRRAKKIARLLVQHGFTVMSGLAEGIDTAAHEGALEVGGKTIAVIGTALNEVYPKSNKALQAELIRDHLVISQVPFSVYAQQGYQRNRFFFPERNKTMSALSEATIIIEASESSGTLTQARACMAQNRKLFILNSCFERGLEWPEKFLRAGAIRVVDGSEILAHLGLS